MKESHSTRRDTKDRVTDSIAALTMFAIFFALLAAAGIPVVWLLVHGYRWALS
jgi:hypothetical protein